MEVNIWAVIAATVGAFVLSGVWYGVFGAEMAKLQKDADTGMPPWKIVVELLRSLTIVLLFAFLLPQLQVSDWQTILSYAFLLWIAFPGTLLVGSIIHENVPVKLAIIHAGDWLLKLVFIALIVGLWR
jgi:hypothetical protein